MCCMKLVLNRFWARLQLMMALAVVAVGCSSDGDAVDVVTTPQIIVMYSPGGLGDQGYNDCILAGVQSFKKMYHDEVDIYQYSPTGIEDAERLLDDWLLLPESKVPALFIVASSDYEDVVADELSRHQLTANKRMLLFESDNHRGLPVTTFRMSMYGASYLAGVVAGEYNNGLDDASRDRGALMVLANDEDVSIAKAAEGFADGFAHHAVGTSVDTEYIADDWMGFVSAQKVYQLMDDWAGRYNYVFPVNSSLKIK